MSLSSNIINLPDFEILETSGNNPLCFKVRYVGKNTCPKCNSKDLKKKDKFYREVRHSSFGDRRTYLRIEARKFHCKRCKKYFNQRFPGILPRKRSTEQFRWEVFNKHHSGTDQSKLSSMLRIGHSTVERWYQDLIKVHVGHRSNLICPRVMGLDEHFFTKKKGYASTFVDLRKHKVFDVALGRSEKSLRRFLKKLKGKDRVQVVVIDLSETYRSIVKKYFPKAMIVTDRFHVIRLINQRFLETWKALDPEGRKSRGLTSLMRRHDYNLKPEQVFKLNRYFESNPAMRAIYDFKQELCKLVNMKHQTAKQCRRHIKKFLSMVRELQDSGFTAMKTLGNTFSDWSQEIVRMWRFTKTNGITEGLHNRMELITRNAFGMRNFENYRLRVKAYCGY